MKSIEENILREKERYLQFAKANKEKNIYIFGAGRISEPLYDFLSENGVTIRAFCVSDKTYNKKEKCGLPIIQIDELNGDKEQCAFLIGVHSRSNGDVEKKILDCGYKYYIKSTEYARYLSDFYYNTFTNPILEITTKMGCAINCKYCPQDVLLKKYFYKENAEKRLSFEKYKLCVDKLPPNVCIEFAGFTEPFLNSDCTDMVLYAYNKGYKVSMFTTLIGMTEEMFRKIEKVQFQEFVLHIPDCEGYSQIPITEEYLQLLDRIVNAKKPDGSNYIDFASSLGTVPEVIRNHLGSDTRVYVTLTDRAGNLDDENLHSQKGITGKIFCEVARNLNHNVLLPDGRVVLCSADFGMKHILGNLFEQSYDEIVEGEEMTYIKEHMSQADDKSVLCRNCTYACAIKGDRKGKK